MASLVAARAVQGAGAALLGACSLALINHAFHDPGERTRALGLWAAGASVALSAGPIIGGVLIAWVGWRSIFFINVPIGAAGLYLTRRYTTETDPADRRIDVSGQLAAVMAMTALAAGLIEGGTAGFTSPFVISGFRIALVISIGLVIVGMLLASLIRPPATPLPRRGKQA